MNEKRIKMVKFVCSTCKTNKEIDPNHPVYETESLTEAFEHIMVTGSRDVRHNILVEYHECD